MKKNIILLCIALFSIATNYAQDSIFDEFEEMDDVTTVVVTKDLFKMASKFKAGGEKGQEYFDIVKSLNNLKFFTTDNKAIAEKMSLSVSKYLKQSKLSELMRVKDKEAKVKIYVKKGEDENHVKELLMFVTEMNKGDKEAVILSLTGNIDLNKISTVVDGYIPNSGKHLKKRN